MRHIDGLIDGALGAEAHASVLAHVATCPGCAASLAAARKARRALEALPRVKPDARLAQRISAAVAREERAEDVLVHRVLGHLPRLQPTPASRKAIRASIAAEASALGKVCSSFTVGLDALLDDELPPGLAIAMRDHAHECPRCRRALEVATAGRAALRAAPRLVPTFEAHQGIQQAIERVTGDRSRARRRVAWAGSAVALCLALAGGLFSAQLRDQAPERTPSVPAPAVSTAAVTPGPEEPGPAPATAVPPKVMARVPQRPASAPPVARRPAPAVSTHPTRTVRPAERLAAPAPDGPVDTYVPPPGEVVVVASAPPASIDATPDPAPAHGYPPPTFVASSHEVSLTL